MGKKRRKKHKKKTKKTQKKAHEKVANTLKINAMQTKKGKKLEKNWEENCEVAAKNLRPPPPLFRRLLPSKNTKRQVPTATIL